MSFENDVLICYYVATQCTDSKKSYQDPRKIPEKMRLK